MQVLDSIVLVDDDKVANAFNKKLLKDLDIARDIVETFDGREAYEYIRTGYHSHKQLPSLLLVDIAMPDMDGIEFIREVKRSGMLAVNKIPLAVLTVSENEKHRKAIKELGDYKFVQKPLDESKIFDILYTEVLPILYSQEKKRYINVMHKELENRMEFLKDQHEYLIKKRDELKKFSQEFRDKIQKYKDGH